MLLVRYLCLSQNNSAKKSERKAKKEMKIGQNPSKTEQPPGCQGKEKRERKVCRKVKKNKRHRCKNVINTF